LRDARRLAPGQDRVTAPGGLVADGDPAQLPTGSTDLADYQRFWCVGRNVATLHHSIPPDSGRPADAVTRILVVRNKNAFDTAHGRLTATEPTVLDFLLTDPHRVVDGSSQVKGKWKELTTQVGNVN